MYSKTEDRLFQHFRRLSEIRTDKAQYTDTSRREKYKVDAKFNVNELNKRIEMKQKAINRHNEIVAQRKDEIREKNILKEMESAKKRQRVLQNESK